MERKNTVYSLLLTYDSTKLDFDPAEYQQNENELIRNNYKTITAKHLNALFQSIRRYKTTRGKYWSGKIIAVSSCEVGYKQYSREYSKSFQEPVRLHVHVLINGEPGSTMSEYITTYWRKRFGLVDKKKLCDADIGCLTEYFSSQRLVKRSLSM